MDGSYLLALFSGGADAAMMVRPPFCKPDPPIPAMARPIINMVDEVAAPQRREPSSKIPKKARKAH